MRWLRRKPKPVVTSPALVCDICNVSLSSTGFYFLTSREVLVSPAYWRRRLDVWLTMAEITGAPESQVVRQSAARTEPPGSGRVDERLCVDMAERAFAERRRGPA